MGLLDDEQTLRETIYMYVQDSGLKLSFFEVTEYYIMQTKQNRSEYWTQSSNVIFFFKKINIIFRGPSFDRNLFHDSKRNEIKKTGDFYVSIENAEQELLN